ncbi:DNA-directed RNA polymerase [Xanthobacter sp. YC-JY1]|uniref:DNA-directed RNA polymerase n=1 Tax=Xanthobacter sp. YC-JY1 TaxID=2419844 RepID=UPI001F38864E|nr:DNA-directed RNA polymerase [Xanthobacter sp. YC-JY1]UJX45784.1 T3/T7 RNA polymerase [Xanthobacter sp. YC-JY1]
MNIETLDLGRELALEEMMRDVGAHRFMEGVRKAEARGALAETAGGLEITRHLLAPMTAAVEKLLAPKRGRGRPAFATGLLAPLPADLIAFLSLHAALNTSAGGCSFLQVCRDIASALEDELRMAVFDERAPALFRTVERSVRRKSWDPVHAELIYAAAARAAEIELPRWSTVDKVHVGTKLIELLIEHTGLLVVEDVPVRKNKTIKQVRLSDIGRRWVDDHNSKASLLRPALTPTVVPPIPWLGTSGGGYLTHAVRPFALVKRTYKAHVEALKAAAMEPVFVGINALQATRWAINRRILGVMEEAMERGILLPGIVGPDPNPLPPTPFDIDTNDAAKREWKERAKLVYKQNAEDEGRRLEMAQLISVGREYRNEPAIFFPHQLDFRGRVYAIPNTLQPQGSDRAKALLHFAEGKPLGKAGLRWLAIHGANVFGFDKASFDDREAWAYEHRQRAGDCAADPLTHRWWTEADSPWSFLAWCFEWTEAWGTGFGEPSPTRYVSRLPIALDGSCNGLQHFSAMLRDPVGGAAVNLLPAEKPQDIYQRVANRTTERLSAVADSDDEKAWVARGWVDFGINRKITKRPVMVLPYGGTMTSCLEYTRAAVREQIKDGKENPFGDELVRAEAYLASIIWASIGDVVVAARQVMTWLQRVARVATRHGNPIQWTTPSGFVAHQEYRNINERRIKSRLRGSIIKVGVFGEADSLDASKQALAISPNFVHSLDASAMMLTIQRCVAEGITSFAMIHDSYGTHAADTDRLAHHLRAAFVSMYTEHNVLEEFRAAVAAALPPEIASELPLPPAMGCLDLHQVEESAYFFA